MRKFIQSALLAGMLLAGASAYAQSSFGIRVGPPPRPRVVRVRPPRPGPDWEWVDGYWFVERGRYRWHDGYWTRPPYAGYRWVAPRYEGGQWFNGYWDGDRGRFEHDHRWDRDRNRRDSERYREHEEHERGRR